MPLGGGRLGKILGPLYVDALGGEAGEAEGFGLQVLAQAAVAPHVR